MNLSSDQMSDVAKSKVLTNTVWLNNNTITLRTTIKTFQCLWKQYVNPWKRYLEETTFLCLWIRPVHCLGEIIAHSSWQNCFSYDILCTSTSYLEISFFASWQPKSRCFLHHTQWLGWYFHDYMQCQEQCCMHNSQKLHILSFASVFEALLNNCGWPLTMYLSLQGKF